jgi:hypothetical protein
VFNQVDVSKTTLRTNNGLDAVLGPLLVGPDRGVSAVSHYELFSSQGGKGLEWNTGMEEG